MNAIIFGASGMVGQGVLRECLLDPRVTKVLSVGRASLGKSDPKLAEVVHKDLYDYGAVKEQLKGYDVCFFCLGVTSAGMSEEAYTKVTFELTVAAAKAMLDVNPGLQLIYVSGAGTDSTEKGRSMWARVKGRTENTLLAMPFKASYMFRPGAIQPLHGIKSRTTAYRIAYAVMGPFMPLMRATGVATTTERVGKAMINIADKGYEKRILETADINRAALGG
jgi:uncharacterized protein YbjT (DUF2867 family)